MKKYDPFARCVKCWSHNSTIEYQKATDLLKRQCDWCLYVWYELPKDSPEEERIEKERNDE